MTKPTIAELEHILAGGDGPQRIEILPNGEIRAVSDWRPIETAPPDVRGLVWVSDHMPQQSPISFGGIHELYPYGGGEPSRYAWAEGLNGDWKITHWMPLPKGPE